MPLENSVFIDTLDPAQPIGKDPIAYVNLHLQNLKKAILKTFPSVKGEVSATHEELSYAAKNPFPKGGVIMWSGALDKIPTGWVLCDGQNGTPDLRDRFVLGASATTAVKATGGFKDAWLPSHTHTATTAKSAGTHSHEVTGKTTEAGEHEHMTMINKSGTNWDGVDFLSSVPFMGSNDGNWQYRTANGIKDEANVGKSSKAGKHTHDITMTIANSTGGEHDHAVTVASTGGDGAGKNLPPFIALAYIMKT